MSPSLSITPFTNGTSITNGTKGFTSDNKPQLPRSVAVYCGANLGTEPAFHHAATSIGHAIATQDRTLVYGGGSQGMMGLISGAVLHEGGSVTAVIPAAMVRAGGEGESSPTGGHIRLIEEGREKVESVVVESMHERKVEMARRAGGFIALPGGYGTFEELMEVAAWTQLGIHTKPVVLVNILKYFDPLRAMIQNAVSLGFIKPKNERLIIFVDCPPDADPATFDWGAATLSAMDGWSAPGPGLFAWTQNGIPTY